MVTSLFKHKVYKAKNEQKILFFFPAGFTKLWWYHFTFNFLNRKNITVIAFDLDWHRAVSELDPNKLHRLLDDINEIVEKVQNDHSNVTEYSVFGTSFGTVIALYIAKKHKNIQSIILNMPYGTIAHLLWTHKPSRPFKDHAIASGLDTEFKLHTALMPIETQANLEILSDRKVVNFTALNDKIVFDGRDFANALSKTNTSAIFHETQFGHFWGGIENILSKRKWDSIL